MGKDVIIACDFPNAEQTLAFLDRFEGRKPFVKIGMELFYGAGPDIVRRLKDRGHPVFLDLKLHDIPNTVKKAMAVLRDLGADICNLHAGGTVRMMEAALEGLTRPDGTRPLLIAVTQLTSTDQEALEKDLLIERPIDEVVMHYALNARRAGLDGVVCSPLEAAKVHEACGKDFLTVTTFFLKTLLLTVSHSLQEASSSTSRTALSHLTKQELLSRMKAESMLTTTELLCSTNSQRSL